MKVAFLDRDGVLNVDYRYVHKWDDFVWVPGAIEGMKKLRDMDFSLIIVTNQSGIARGFYTEDDFLILMDEVKADLKRFGVSLLDVFFCPHHIEGKIDRFKIDCDCRKPRPGMLKKAIKKYGIDLNSSILIGDQDTDILAGNSAGIEKCFKVDSCVPKNLKSFFRNDAPKAKRKLS